jgi:hypothetical protein
MGRAMASSVSTLLGFVANGHQLLHPVSSSPSEIPYGGFSPVRLQTGLGPPPSPTGTHPPAYKRPESRSSAALLAPEGAIAVLSRRQAAVPRDRPVQRPLARRRKASPSVRVILSRRVVAYYGLIRDSRPLPPTYGFRRRVFASRPRPGGSLLYSACPSVRAVCRTPADRVVKAASNATRDSLRPFVRGSASAVSMQKSVHAWSCNEAAQFALCCGPDRRWPCTDTGRLLSSFHPMSYLAGTSSMTTRRNSQLPWPDFHRLDKQPCRLRHELHEFTRIKANLFV